MAYRASTLANLNPVISPAFVKANYEALESLLRDRRRQMRNDDPRTQLEYFSEDYDEERDMKPRPEPTRAATPPLRVASPRILRRRERTMGGNEGQSANLPPFLAAHLGRGENGKPLQSSLTSAYEGQALPNNIGVNLPSNGTFLSYHAQPFIPASLSIPNGFMPTHIHPYQQPTSLVNGQHLSFHTQTPPRNLPMGEIPVHLPQEGHAPQTFANNNMPSQNGFTYPANMPTNSYPFYTQTMDTFPNMPVYTNPNLTRAVLNPVGSVTPFVRWIEDYPLPDGLKIPSHIGSYDGKGDPDNFLYLFERAIRMQKWLMPPTKEVHKDASSCHNIKQREGERTRAFITRYTDDTLQILSLHEEQRISSFVHGLRTRSLVEHLSTYLPSTYKGLIEKTYTWVEAKEVATNDVSNNQRDDLERSKKFYWGNSIGQKDRGRFPHYKGQNHKLLSNLVESPREILATEKLAKAFEQPPRFPGAYWSKDKTRYCHFHEDH
nr:hypothetical protein [Tanacetum cinerariifolium]